MSNDAFHSAVLALTDNGNEIPLMDYLRSPAHLGAIERNILANLINLYVARSRPKKAGRPGYNSGPKDGAQYAAFLAEKMRRAWLHENGKQRVPADVNDMICRRAVSELERISTANKSADVEQVKKILAEGKLHAHLRSHKTPI